MILRFGLGPETLGSVPFRAAGGIPPEDDETMVVLKAV